MGQPLWKKQSPVIAAVLVFAVLGTFVFSTSPISHITETEDNPYSTGLFIPVNCAVDWLAETTAVYRTGKVSSSILRTGMLCMLTPVELYSAGEYLAAFSIHIKSVDFSNIKDNVPLMLRI